MKYLFLIFMMKHRGDAEQKLTNQSLEKELTLERVAESRN